MNISMAIKMLVLTGATGLALALPAYAQQAPAGCAAANAACANSGNGAPGAGMRGMKGGRGMGGGGSGMRGGRGVARDLITPDERAAHQAKMRNVKTYDECVAAQTEFRGVMEVRAKEKGVTLPSPRQNRCDIMKNRGLIK